MGLLAGAARTANAMRDKLTTLDMMVTVAAAAVGCWGAISYRAGIPLPVVARPGVPLLPLFLSVPVGLSLTWGLLAIPARTLRERAREIARQPGTALCVAAAASSLGVIVRWSLRAWMRPYADGSFWVYGASLLLECASWCGLGVIAATVLLALSGRFWRQEGWIEWARIAVAGYWLALFLVFSAV